MTFPSNNFKEIVRRKKEGEDPIKSICEVYGFFDYDRNSLFKTNLEQAKSNTLEDTIEQVISSVKNEVDVLKKYLDGNLVKDWEDYKLLREYGIKYGMVIFTKIGNRSGGYMLTINKGDRIFARLAEGSNEYIEYLDNKIKYLKPKEKLYELVKRQLITKEWNTDNIREIIFEENKNWDHDIYGLISKSKKSGKLSRQDEKIIVKYYGKAKWVSDNKEEKRILELRKRGYIRVYSDDDVSYGLKVGLTYAGKVVYMRSSLQKHTRGNQGNIKEIEKNATTEEKKAIELINHYGSVIDRPLVIPEDTKSIKINDYSLPPKIDSIPNLYHSEDDSSDFIEKPNQEYKLMKEFLDKYPQYKTRAAKKIRIFYEL